MNVQQLRQAVASWATTEPLVRRVYLFGSRARGEERPDSDVDLAVLCNVDPEMREAYCGDLWSAFYGTWSDYRDRWLTALQGQLPLLVDLHHATHWDRRAVWPGLKLSRVCLYRRGVAFHNALQAAGTVNLARQ